MKKITIIIISTFFASLTAQKFEFNEMIAC